MPVDVKKYVDIAIAKAQEYNAKNIGTINLAGKDAAETADIAAFLRDKPYQGDAVKTLVEKLLTDGIKNAKPNADKSDIIYLSGPNGAKETLAAAVEDKTVQKPAIAELRPMMDNAVTADFKQMKKTFADSMGKPAEPYGKWRGLFSGVDNALENIARDNKLNFVRDNALAPLGVDAKNKMIARLMKEKDDRNMKVYAVALSLEDAMSEAKKLGINEQEASTKARSFHDFFTQIKMISPDVTLVDKDMNVIYSQRSGKETVRDAAKLDAWNKSYEQAAAGKNIDYNVKIASEIEAQNPTFVRVVQAIIGGKQRDTM